MKTKIIYISGGEKFDMADVRTAFEEVRSALGLDDDTIMFGVPVDKDDALADNVTETITESIPEPEAIAPETTISEIETPKKRGRKKVVDEPKPEISTELEDVEPENIEPEPEHQEEKVVPILSVLGGAVSEPEPEAEIEIKHDAVITHEIVEDEDSVSETFEIHDVITPDLSDETEKTLEELLESMEPLQEDEELDLNDVVEPTISDDTDVEDATLQQLATEFVENQDKIVNTTKPSTRGKIGKLKNILPFKKQKHEESSLMGDLFGWAGVAANDEDFSMPGFFSGAKK